MLRQPIVVFVGHVDHGKTSLLDAIRKTAVVTKEAGGITQAISASSIDAASIKNTCSALLERFRTEVEVPGLLFIDTPGHEAFTTLRRRGGSIADIAVLVIDVHEGFQPQTDESLEVLKHYRTPFVVAVTKIDKISGWAPQQGRPFVESVGQQPDRALGELEKKTYDIVAQLSQRGFASDRFDRITDFRKQVAVVPVSSVTGEGVADLLMMITGLAQQFLRERLGVGTATGKGTILEVKQTRGMGTTIDAVLYDGEMRRNDWLVVGGAEPLVTRVRALVAPVDGKMQQVDGASAASGVRISAPGLEEAVPGSPLRAVRAEPDVEKAKQEVEEEVASVEFTADAGGVTVKADTLGSLEALIKILQDRQIPLRRAEIGAVTRADVTEMQAAGNRVLLAFNVAVLPEASGFAKSAGVRVFQNSVIYRLIEEYRSWLEEETKKTMEQKLAEITRPCKIRALPGFVFRASGPAVFGVEVLAGILKPGYRLEHADGSAVGTVKELQDQGENIREAEAGKRVAVSMPEPTVGRHVKEGDVLVAALSERDIEALNGLRDKLRDDEKALLDERGI